MRLFWLLALAFGFSAAVYAQEDRQLKDPPAAQQQPAPRVQPPPVKPVPPAEQGQARQTRSTRGKILRTQGTDQVVVRTTDNQEMVFFTNPQTRYTFRGAAGQFTDLRVGADVNLGYIEREGRLYVLTVGDVPAEPVPPQGAQVQPAQPAKVTTINGTVVRVVGQDQVVIKADGDKEVIIYVTPETKYMLDDQPVRFADLRPGTTVRVDYDLRDRRYMGRGIFWRRAR